jgi:ketosteroid isomerase-like protein
MRKLLFVTALLLLAGITFGQTKKSDQVDIEAEITEINKLVDKLEEATQKGDMTTFVSHSADEVLVCGTDPSEFWNKEQLLGIQNPDSNNNFEFKHIDDRVVKVAPDGNSAIVVNQLMIGFSPNIPLRMDYHLIKTGEGWKVFFMNVALIPKNEHLGVINEAIE